MHGIKFCDHFLVLPQTKFPPLLDFICSGFPLLVMKQRMLFMKESVSRLWSEQQAIPLNITSLPANQKGPKTIYTNIGKGGLVWSDSIFRQVHHLLLSNRCLSPSAVETDIEGSSHCNAFSSNLSTLLFLEWQSLLQSSLSAYALGSLFRPFPSPRP